MTKWSLVFFGGTSVLILLTFSGSFVKIAAAAAVSSLEHSNGFEDSDTEAVVIDGIHKFINLIKSINTSSLMYVRALIFKN